MTVSKIFFSYTREDSDFALQLATDLRKAGADVWMDRLIRAGSRWDDEVEKALQLSESLLVILTPDSVSSQNVSDEISYAFDEKKTVIPVLLKECKIPFRLRRLQYADFTKEYDRGFTELLKSLNLAVSTHVKNESGQSNPAKAMPEAKELEKKNKQKDFAQNKKGLKKQTIKKEKDDTVLINPTNNPSSANLNDKEKVLLRFDDINYSYDRKNNKASLHGNLIINRHSIKFEAFDAKESFLIKDITDISFLPATGEFYDNYMKVIYYSGTDLKVIYFMRFTFFTEKPTLVMFNQIQELIVQKKFILVKK